MFARTQVREKEEEKIRRKNEGVAEGKGERLSTRSGANRGY